MNITNKGLRIAAGEKMYERGLKCYINNQVEYIEADDKSGDLNIRSRVRSSLGKDYYEVSIKILRGSTYVSSNCECKYWGIICKHSVATLIKYINEKNIILEESEKRRKREFIESIKENFLKEVTIDTKPKDLCVSYKLCIDSAPNERYISLELKVGEDKLYVVKNMRELLKSIIKKQKLIFGKNFILNPYIHRFKEKDKKIINMLLELYEYDEIAKNINFANISSFLNGKKAYVSETMLKNFFNIIDKDTIELKLDDENYKEISFIKEDLPLEFSLQRKKDKLILKQGGCLPRIISKGYFFYNDKIYEPSLEQINLYGEFIKGFTREEKIEISFDESFSDDIASYIIPSLKKISKTLYIEDEFKERLYQEKLISTVYFDRKDDKVTADIIFTYGDVKLNPFQYNNRLDHKILVRNIEGEKAVTNLLERFSFKKGIECYELEEEEKLLDFLIEGIEMLQQYAEVYYSEVFKNIKVYNSSNYKSNVKLNNEDLLEFSFSIEGVDKKELFNIFSAIKQRKKYYRLKNGGFIPLNNNEILDMGSIIDYLNIKASDFKKDVITLPKFNAVYIDNSLKEKEIDFVEKNKKFKELVNSIRDIKDIDYDVPKSLQSIMRPYQRFGFKWFKTLANCGFGGILADEMGLGKTLQTIAFIKSEVEENKNKPMPSLVVCPTSLVYNWEDEIKKFQPDLKCTLISGDKESREESIKAIDTSDIVITSYALIRRDIDKYEKVKFRYCFLDEAQNIKNPQSLNAQSVKSIKANNYFALTGTPVENSLTELWSIFDFIMPGYLLNYRRFYAKYESPIVKDKNEEALKELNNHIKPFILRRLKKHVIKELPPKIEHNIVVNMTEEQKKVYASFAESAKKEFYKEIRERGFNKSKIKILSIITRLRQICCDPSTFIENYEGSNGKTETLLDIVNSSINAGHKILLFSQFTSVLKNIAEVFKANNINYLYLDGSTKADVRGSLVKDFNNGKGDIFLISLKAGGTGLNLTSADIVIHFDPWWNPAVEDQASDRAHRIGQKKTVEVIRLIAKGTIEEKIYKIQQKKKEIIDKVIDKNLGEEVLLSNMAEYEVEELFKF
ncbi:SNF2 helicase associated domain-containing protein [Clostridium botulinum]|uniref:SNF2 helicase associated domain-containing protein n=1 Tax=Clostridium botulinum TaxID=1491 RepID=UPI0007744286|nr:SNF2 helicase associated domain-containing protein [Clostridium botulinum]APU60602.1 DEAD/DEAH box helicase family protein [Clostridium botulinum]AUN03227.1 helicase [Clostridium botulinum]MBN3397257.1 helicase [Clostridium botulinum]MBN3412922.1 helicase [Clostridium botulinum]MBY6875605.1 SNF2 helicase associated domain-containing protein [Clostridium botulinum]